MAHNLILVEVDGKHQFVGDSLYLLEWLLSKRQEITSAGEDVERGEPSTTVGGNVNLYNHYIYQYGDSSEKLKKELPYDPAIPLLGIYPKNTKTLIQKDKCSPVFTTVLFTITKI